MLILPLHVSSNSQFEMLNWGQHLPTLELNKFKHFSTAVSAFLTTIASCRVYGGFRSQLSHLFWFVGLIAFIIEFLQEFIITVKVIDLDNCEACIWLSSCSITHASAAFFCSLNLTEYCFRSLGSENFLSVECDRALRWLFFVCEFFYTHIQEDYGVDSWLGLFLWKAMESQWTKLWVFYFITCRKNGRRDCLIVDYGLFFSTTQP